MIPFACIAATLGAAYDAMLSLSVKLSSASDEISLPITLNALVHITAISCLVMLLVLSNIVSDTP